MEIRGCLKFPLKSSQWHFSTRVHCTEQLNWSLPCLSRTAAKEELPFDKHGALHIIKMSVSPCCFTTLFCHMIDSRQHERQMARPLKYELNCLLLWEREEDGPHLELLTLGYVSAVRHSFMLVSYFVYAVT